MPLYYLFILSNENKKNQSFNGKVDDRVHVPHSKLDKGAELKAAASALEMASWLSFKIQFGHQSALIGGMVVPQQSFLVGGR